MKPFTPRKSSIADRTAKLVKILEKGLNGESAVSKLAAIGRENPAIVSLILPLFEHTDPYVRVNAVHTLRDMGDSAAAAIPQLVTLLDDQDLEVLLSAVQALGDIGLSARSAIPQLILLLQHPSGAISSFAADALKKMGELPESAIATPSIPDLIILLKDPDSSIRSNAITMLNAIGKLDQVAIPELIRLLKLEDPDSENRNYLLYTLKNIGKPTIPDLITLLIDQDRSIRDSAISLFSSMDISDEAAAVPELIRLFKSEDLNSDDRRTIVAILVNIGKPVVPDLIILIQDQNPSIRREVFELSEFLGEWLESAIPVLLEALKNEEPNSTIFNVIFRIFVKIGRHTIPELINLLQNPNPSIRREAVWALEKIGNPSKSAIPQLKVLLADTNLEVRMSAITVLGSLGEPLAEFTASELLPCLKDINVSTRNSIVNTLGRIGKSATLQVLFFLQDPDPGIRRTVIYILSSMKQPPKASIPELIRLFKDDDPDFPLWEGIAVALGRIGKSAVEPLILLLQDLDPYVRYYAVIAFQSMGSSSRTAIPYIVPLLKDSDADIRSMVVWTLGCISQFDRSVIPSFIPLLQDPEQRVRSSVVEALNTMGLSAQLAIPKLIQCLKDSTMGDRTPIVTLLGKLGKPAQSAIPHLSQMLKDPNSEVSRDELIAVLKKLRSFQK